MKQSLFGIILISVTSLWCSMGPVGVAQSDAGQYTVVNIVKFGAIGDGRTDDTQAIQKAIDNTPDNGVLLIPSSKAFYKITDHLLLKSNLTVKGENATIFMPAHDNGDASAFFYTLPTNDSTNIDISGLVLKSENKTQGLGYWGNSNTSNVMGFDFEHAGNVYLHGIIINQALVGIKLSTALNSHFKIDHVKILNTATDIYMSHSSDIHITNSWLDSTGFSLTDHHLHNVYIESAVENVSFDNMIFSNTAGAGVHIYQESNSPARGITITNSKFNNCHVALVVWYAQNVNLTHFWVSSTPTVISINDAHDVTVSQGDIQSSQDLLLEDKDNSTNIVLDDLTIDATTKTTKTDFEFANGENITISHLKVRDK